MRFSQLVLCAKTGHFGFNIICIVEESGRFKSFIVGQEWAVTCR
jgi:hypothetical protein